MTNEQKAEVIAVWDNLMEIDGFVHKLGIKHITELYLTDLNYLVPVAVKVRRETHGYDEWIILHDAFNNLTKSPEGTYQQLFDAVYNGIVYLKEQAE